MTGRVDDYGRALVAVTIHHPQTGNSLAIDAWIDTAFTWTLLLTKQQVGALGLAQASMLPGTFADGSAASFESYACLVEWFGRRRGVQAACGAGKFALIGIGLLEDCTVLIDYPKRLAELSLAGSNHSA